MFSMIENENGLEFTFSSTFHFVDRICDALGPYIAKEDPDAGTQELLLVARELLLNAVEHGNQKDPEKKALFSVNRIGAGRYRVRVEDQGPGFDYRTLAAARENDIRRERERGFSIVQAHSDEMAFNEKGNQVTAYITLRRATAFKMDRVSAAWILIPSADITAACAGDFRKTLLEWADSGGAELVINLGLVENMDSVALSVLFCFSQSVAGLGKTRIVRLTGVNAGLRDLFFLTRLNRLYQVETI